MAESALADLDVPALLGRLGVYPRRITSDSRRVEPGIAFAAFPGHSSDGRKFVPDAIARGASAVLWDSRAFQWDPAWQAPHLGIDGCQLFDRQVGQGILEGRELLAGEMGDHGIAVLIGQGGIDVQ